MSDLCDPCTGDDKLLGRATAWPLMKKQMYKQTNNLIINEETNIQTKKQLKNYLNKINNTISSNYWPCLTCVAPV